MAILTKLKISKKERAGSRETVEQRLRRQMIDRLKEQRGFVSADIAGEKILKTTTRFIPNKLTGEVTRQEVPVRIRRWYWQEPTGAACMNLLYGSSTIKFHDDSSTIEIKELTKVPETIDMLIEAVEAGELDGAMKAALDERREKFRRAK